MRNSYVVHSTPKHTSKHTPQAKNPIMSFLFIFRYMFFMFHLLLVRYCHTHHNNIWNKKKFTPQISGYEDFLHFQLIIHIHTNTYPTYLKNDFFLVLWYMRLYSYMWRVLYDNDALGEFLIDIFFKKGRWIIIISVRWKKYS